MSLCLTKDAPECESKSESLHDSHLLGKQNALRSEESSGLMSLKMTEMGEKPDHLLASDRANVVSGNPDSICVLVACTLVGLGNSVSGILSVFTAYSSWVGLGVRESPFPCSPLASYPMAISLAWPLRYRSLSGAHHPFCGVVVSSLTVGQEFFCPPQPSRQVSLARNLKTPSMGFSATPALLTPSIQAERQSVMRWHLTDGGQKGRGKGALSILGEPLPILAQSPLSGSGLKHFPPHENGVVLPSELAI